ncbi:unnamed protein product [Symbiodinium sp. CCMP2592]|nr:unnamed protein product [Symbiodinium sp. CCMP2592]
MWLRVLLPTCDATFRSRDDQSNSTEAKTPRDSLVATWLIFRYPSVPDGVTLRSGFVEAMPRVVPRLGKDVNFEAFSSAFAERQVVFVRSAERQARKPSARRRRIGLSLLRQLYSAYPAVLRRAFHLESSGSLPASEAPKALDRLLGSTRTPPGSWYASFVLQRSRKALSEFLTQTMGPAGAPKFLVERPPRNGGSAAIKLPKHSNAAWVFFGRNPGSRILRGRPEHTDAIQHSGTWHVQLKGEKVWTLKPTDELRRKVPSLKRAGRVRVRCMEGDVLCINTRLWWHSTHIPARCKLSLSVARDMYLDGTRPGACDMTNVDGHYALKPIQKGAVIFTEDTAPQLELPRSSASNCELRESQRGSLVVVAKRVIKKGEWFSLSDSDAETARAEEPRGAKRKR